MHEDGDTDNDDATAQTVSGQLLHTDEGNPDAFAYFGVKGQDDSQQTQTGMVEHGEPVNGKYGYITVDPATGKWTYTLFNGENGRRQPGAESA